MTRVIWDFGNARWKYYVPSNKTKGDFRHALAILRDSEWNDIVGRGNPPEGIARINGVPYAFGDAARRHIIKDRPKGAARYVPEYYGAATAFGMAESLQSSDRVFLYASHAPGDIAYAPKLIEAVKGEWTIECRFGTLKINIKSVNVFDEPLGGFAHATLNEDGTDKKKNPFVDKTILVIDVGGWTADIVAVDPGGLIDLMSAKSTRTGTINMFEKFESALRKSNIDNFQRSGDLDIRRIESALLTGSYKFGKLDIPCQEQSNAAVNELVNDIIGIIESAGGPANYDTMLLTGGGGALIYNTLSSAMPEIDFVLAEPIRDNMKFANVFGGAKLAELVKKANAANA